MKKDNAAHRTKRIAAHSQLTTTSSNKVNHSKRICNHSAKLSEAFSTPQQYGGIAFGKTMLQVAKETGIERASVCRFVASLRKLGMIYSCGRHLCPISGHHAEFLTTNYHVSLNYLASIPMKTYRLHGSETQFLLMNAINDHYVQHKEVNLKGEAKRIWEDEVKPLIKRETGL